MSGDEISSEFDQILAATKYSDAELLRLAVDAAWPGLPECITLAQATRRIARAPDAVDATGRLLPQVVSERAEYGWRYRRPDLDWTRVARAGSREEAEANRANLVRMGAIAEVMTRTIRTLIDEGAWTGPWLPVEEGTQT